MYFKYSTKSETREYGSKLYNRLSNAEEIQNNSNISNDLFVDETVVLHENNNLIAELNETIKSIQNLYELKKSDNVMNDFLYLGKTQKKGPRSWICYLMHLSLSHQHQR